MIALGAKVIGGRVFRDERETTVFGEEREADNLRLL
jgi:hypothetical protein